MPFTAHDARMVVAKQRSCKIIVYEKLVEDAFKHVRTRANNGYDHTVFTIHPVCFGYPLFDQAAARQYVLLKLAEAGFDVRARYHSDIVISWKEQGPRGPRAKPPSRARQGSGKSVRFAG